MPSTGSWALAWVDWIRTSRREQRITSTAAASASRRDPRQWGANLVNNSSILHRYWIKFDVAFGQRTWGVLLGCGVTASDIETALKMVKEQVFNGAQVLPILSIVEDIQLSLLDQDHVIPNIGKPDMP